MTIQVSRSELKQLLISRIVGLSFSYRATVVAVDGTDLSGKTLLSHELQSSLCAIGNSAVVIHGDDFATSKSHRYRQGQWSTAGFYEDFFDYGQAIREVMLPVRNGQRADVQVPLFDGTSDSPYGLAHYTVPPQGYLIFEGLFLLKPESKNLFDLVIRLKIPSSLVLERAMLRDVPKLGDAEFVRKHYLLQPIPAQEQYERQCDPDGRADIVFDNSDIEHPVILKG